MLTKKRRLGEAIACYHQAIALDPKLAQAHGALGQALLRQGRFTEARDATRRALDLLPERAPLRGRVTQQLQACERLLALDEKLPAVLKGDAQPAGTQERLQLADLCVRYKKRYVAAVGFFTAAFAAEPMLATDLQRQHRYNAACCAALAAAGKGEDAATLDDQERARLRQQARTWLAADLALWAQQADSDDPNTRALVRKTLAHWQADTDLAGIREPEALKQLPADEQQACRQLWADVAALPRPGGAARVAARMAHWQKDDDFAGVRDPALARLPAEERAAWQRLWADVAALLKKAETPATQEGKK
ncbi:MAG TPA: tetratricopeptide repeat protein [Gemmataceae bacterium]|nr:tetratricopeptide repeat protein [Gemmataceae bacterium]